jgi:outer membrane lipoprotein SlyB
MKTLRTAISITLLAALMGLGQMVAMAQTQSRMNDQQMRALLTRLNQRTQTFSTNLDASLGRNGASSGNTADQIQNTAVSYSRAVADFRAKWDNGRATSDDASYLLNQAAQVDRDLQRSRFDTTTVNSWSDVRYELDQLAAAYDLNWRWNDGVGGYNTNNSGGYSSSNSGGYSTNGGNGSGTYHQSSAVRNALTGTYALDVQRSDDPRTSAEAALRGSSNRNRQGALDDLTAKLEAPDRMAIERQGQSVTIESSRASQVTVVADGSVRTDQDQNGDPVQLRSTLSGDRLTINSTGTTANSRANDYEATFEPFNNGRSLRVTRRVSSEYTYRPVTVQSVYTKTSEIAEFDVNGSSTSGGSYSSSSGPVSGDFIVPDNVVLMGVLNSPLSTKTARENDRFTMTVRTPTEYEGAVIEGHVSNVQRSGRVTGRSTMTLNFDSIRLRDGSSYRFTALVESVRTQGGDEVKVNNEGTVQSSDSRGNTTAKRAAVGTALGAIIGAIAGGGKGAAIGATVGAGAGAGSVYAQGKDDLDLNNGTELRIRSNTPRDYSDTH